MVVFMKYPNRYEIYNLLEKYKVCLFSNITFLKKSMIDLIVNLVL
jgi:hypothetical protein